MNLTAEQEARIKQIVEQWHESNRATFTKSYSNLDYDSPAYRKTFRVAEKYVHLINGTSGAFMVDIETGNIYEIKGWGVPNKKKIAGVAWDPGFDGAQLEKARFVRGPYDFRSRLPVGAATA